MVGRGGGWRGKWEAWGIFCGRWILCSGVWLSDLYMYFSLSSLLFSRLALHTGPGGLESSHCGVRGTILRALAWWGEKAIDT